jgi:PIN domain nuclease of toxin-antitoxin system
MNDPNVVADASIVLALL